MENIKGQKIRQVIEKPNDTNTSNKIRTNLKKFHKKYIKVELGWIIKNITGRKEKGNFL